MIDRMISQRAAATDVCPASAFVAARNERVRAALWRLLEDEPGVEPLAATADVADTLRLLERLKPAVVVVDESLLGQKRLRELQTLVAFAPQAAFIVVGMHDDPGYVAWARDAGATDYVRLDEATERLGRAVVDASALPHPRQRRRPFLSRRA